MSARQQVVRVAIALLVAGCEYEADWRTLGADAALGDGSADSATDVTEDRVDPDARPPGAVVTHIATGVSHTCARLADGTVRCWGFNAVGQLGDGTTTDRQTPVAVTGLTAVAELAAGSSHTCARRTDGTAVCWGSNYYGQLG